MSALAVPALPTRSGAYRWFYTDVHAGPYTAVAIFMIGSVFSPYYAAARRRGARPVDHSAVNFALYRAGRRQCWVLSEYRAAAVRGGRRLEIGHSALEYGAAGGITIDIAERTALGARPIRARLALKPLGPCGGEWPLDPRGVHVWHPLAVRARATLHIGDGEVVTGLGYHDANHGEERLGDGLPGWRWSRIHGPERTLVRYRLPAPLPTLELIARPGRVDLRRMPTAPDDTHTSPWGLALPSRLRADTIDLAVRHVLESSPFYARQEADDGIHHALGEVASFRRFHSPLIRWMARFRTRLEQSA